MNTDTNHGESDVRAAAKRAIEAWDNGDVSWFANANKVMDDLRAAASAEPAAAPAAKQQAPNRTYMPLLGTAFGLRMDVLCEKQAQANHGQTLARLAERGGLSVQEAAAVISRRDWRAFRDGPVADALLAALHGEGPTELEATMRKALSELYAYANCDTLGGARKALKAFVAVHGEDAS